MGVLEMSEKKSRIPKFANEDEEREFWATHDATDYFDETDEITEPLVGPRRKKLINFRIEDDAIERLKKLADRKGMGWQTLMRALIYEGLEEEEKRVG